MSNSASDPMLSNFDNSYARLPDRFFSRLHPTPVSAPSLLSLNSSLAEELGLDNEFLTSAAGIDVLAGNAVPDASDPLAMVYAGHQFGGWAPQLGDGRAILLGELLSVSGERFDMQLKGAGPTPYSRMGDGRAWIGPVLREYIVSEAMAALGIPTTRALAAVATGDVVRREGAMPGAILTRIASSHIRVGTFEYFVARKDVDGLRVLADYVIDRHCPDCKQAADPYAALLKSVVEKQAALVASWMSVGFIHGVMNTDNMTISGQTIDYGPCAFMDAFNPAQVYSSIDQGSRYAYQNQPRVAQWNLAVLAQSILPLIAGTEEESIASAQQIVDSFPRFYETRYLELMSNKLGLTGSEENDLELIEGLLRLLENGKADFTLSFRALSSLAGAESDADQPFFGLFGSDPESENGVEQWLRNWRHRLVLGGTDDLSRISSMRAVNAAYIPRNHQIERIIQSALRDDLVPFREMVDLLANPYEEQSEFDQYRLPPQSHEVVQHTFCGT